MGPYKITMRLDFFFFCGNRATSRGRVILLRSLSANFFFLLLFFCVVVVLSFILSRRSVAGSEQVQPLQRIVDRTTNYGTIILYICISPNKIASSFHQRLISSFSFIHSYHRFIELFPLVLVRLSAISLLPPISFALRYLVFLHVFSDC